MQLNKIILEKLELRPERLQQTLVFNDLTLADQVWLANNYTEERLAEILTNNEEDELLKMASRFLDNKSKELLFKTEIKVFDDFGDEVKLEKLTLGQKLKYICSQKEYLQLLKIVVDLRVRSAEQVNKLVEDQKKSEEERQTKLNGMKSST